MLAYCFLICVGSPLTFEPHEAHRWRSRICLVLDKGGLPVAQAAPTHRPPLPRSEAAEVAVTPRKRRRPDTAQATLPFEKFPGRQPTFPDRPVQHKIRWMASPADRVRADDDQSDPEWVPYTPKEQSTKKRTRTRKGKRKDNLAQSHTRPKRQ
jgi:hypothetical protein